MTKIEPIALETIQQAQGRIRAFALRTPLIRLNHAVDGIEIYLKLENLQPIGSFKVRGAGNAMQIAGKEALTDGVYTASAGNMAQGVGWVAGKMGVPFQVVVPDHAPATKLASVARLGGETIKLPLEDWWRVVIEHQYPGLPGLFIHPVCNPDVIAGNGTIGLEIMDDLPDVDAVVIPYGGGGLTTGIASALRALKPSTRIYACEVENAAPLSQALSNGEPVEIDYTPSFVDGIGGKMVLPEMWQVVRKLVNDSLLVSLSEVADAIRLLAERHRVIAEGAGAAPVAAALAGRAGKGKVVCVVSGGNLDAGVLARILQNETPSE